MPCTIKAWLSDDMMSVHFDIQSPCPMVQSFARYVKPLDAFMGLEIPMIQNPIYLAADGAIKHCACAIPSAVLKAAEVASGQGLKRDVHMTISD